MRDSFFKWCYVCRGSVPRARAEPKSSCKRQKHAPESAEPTKAEVRLPGHV